MANPIAINKSQILPLMLFLLIYPRTMSFSSVSYMFAYHNHKTSFHKIKNTINQRSFITKLHSFNKGDVIKLRNDDIKGVIKEKRGSGWYTIQLLDSSNTIIKRRIGDIVPVTTTDLNINKNTANTSNKSTTSTKEEKPYIINLDELLRQFNPSENTISLEQKEYINQIHHISKIKRWITFTDLHVSTTTLSTCTQILQKVHDVGCSFDEECGILFLGDFWHHRGVLRIDCLNNILEALKDWTLPCIFIPGNHDQVTWSGESHGLTPLQNAYRIQNNTIPGPLILTHPTLFNNALFIPHIRNTSTLKSILTSSDATSQSTKALFIHADVTGAYMNDLITSKGGISPKYFPSSKYIYSGHFHKSHVIKTKNEYGDEIQVEYIGSPYEISLSEAGQSKYLYVLDKDWKCIDKVELDIGRKHYRFKCSHDFLKEEREYKSGDRIIIIVNHHELYNIRNTTTNNSFDEKVNLLRKNGIQVEIRETAVSSEHTNTAKKEDLEKEDLTPQATLSSYLSHEVENRKSIDANMSKQLEQEALLLIDELSNSNSTKGSSCFLDNNNATDLVLESISLQGFGSFQDEVIYPLNNRGLVLLRGSNRETAGFDSNGSGKSTLVVSILWAITGQIDSRPLDDFKVTDVINDSSKMAKVTLQGTINEKKFIINRTKTASKSILTFNFNNQDLTRQSIKETQQVINEILSGNFNGIENTQKLILSRTFFHGQHHSINGLLESTDVKLKEELSNIVPLSLWQEATMLARKKIRQYGKEINEIDGKVSIRTSDYDDLSQKCNYAETNFKIKCDALYSLENDTKSDLEKYDLFIEDELKIYETIQSYQIMIDDMNRKIIDLEREKEKIQVDKMNEIRTIQDDLKLHTNSFSDVQKDILINENDLNKVSNSIINATRHYDTILSKWGVGKVSFISDSNNTFSVIMEENNMHIPKTCPTCNQKIDDKDNHNSHHAIETFIKNEILSAKKLVQNTMIEKENLITALHALRFKRDAIQTILNEYQNKMNLLEDKWKEQSSYLNDEILTLRNSLQSKTTEMSNLAVQLQKISNYRSQKSDTESAIQRKRDDVSIAQSSYESICKERDAIYSNMQKLKVDRDKLNQKLFIANMLSDILGARGIQSYILQNAVTSLQLSTQSYLDILSDGSQKLDLNLDSSDRISRIASIRSSNGEWTTRPLSSLSGGQWRRCSLSFQLGFSDMIAKRGKFTSSLLVLDEPLTHLDTAGRAHVGQVLKRFLVNNDTTISALKYSTIIVILQDLVAQELEDIFDSIDEVVKYAGKSVVNVDSGDGML